MNVRYFIKRLLSPPATGVSAALFSTQRGVQFSKTRQRLKVCSIMRAGVRLRRIWRLKVLNCDTKLSPENASECGVKTYAARDSQEPIPLRRAESASVAAL